MTPFLTKKSIKNTYFNNFEKMKSDQNIYTKDIKLQHFYKFLWRSIIPLRKV